MRFKVLARGHWINDIKKTYKDLIPIHPDIIFYVFGTISNAIGMLRSDQFNPGTCCVYIIGRPVPDLKLASISEVSYQLEAWGNPLKVNAVNIHMIFSFPDSHGQVDRALDRAPEAIGTVFEEIEAAFKKRTLTERLSPSIVELICNGSSSLGYGYIFDRRLREHVPDAYFTRVYQVNGLPEVSKEEVKRRFNLLMRSIAYRTGREVNFIIQFPYISSLGSSVDVNSQGEFNDRLIEFLGFLTELEAEYRSYIKARATSPSLDLERDRLYEQGIILLVSTVNYRPVNLDEVKWFLSSKLLEPFKNELKNRLFIIGLFSSIDMLNSVKDVIGGNVRAFALRSSRWDRKYVIGLRIAEDEAKALLWHVHNAE
jgi:hypothetical protein